MSGLNLLQMTIILKVRTEKTFWTFKQHCLLSHECFKLALVSARHWYETTANCYTPKPVAQCQIPGCQATLLWLFLAQTPVPKGARRGPSIFLVVNASSGLNFLWTNLTLSERVCIKEIIKISLAPKVSFDSFELVKYCNGRAVQASSSYGPWVPPPLLSSQMLPASDWLVHGGTV